MKIINRNDLPEEFLPGRMIQKAVGKGAFSESGKMTMGYAFYSDESDPMEPHHHAEEIVHIISSEKGWARKGSQKDKLGDAVPLEAGMTLHFPPLEWHVFEFEPGGHVDIIFFYGQVDNIRPEEMK